VQSKKKRPNTRLTTDQTGGRECWQTLAVKVAKSSLSSNGNNAKDKVD